MLDFTELSQDGQDLELLVREILFRKGFTVQWSGKGADGGRDLICIERFDSFFAADEKRWLIQCKHNARSGKSVGVGDLDNIVDSCHQHNCKGYLLVSSTQPSSAVVQRLESITASAQNSITAICWDAVKLEQILLTPKNWSLVQRFFPISANAEGWQIYATEYPNLWIVNYKGYYFHLSNRIGSHCEQHLDGIKCRVAEIDVIKLPEDHFIRIRAVYYDDKNGAYRWYLDYMYPNDQMPTMTTGEIAHLLGDGFILNDGQEYNFDVTLRSYFKYSDHFDPDHADYYISDTRFFKYGIERARNYEEYQEAETSRQEIQRMMDQEKDKGFKVLEEKIKQLSFLRIIRSCNSRIEDLDKFYLKKNWSEIIEDFKLESDHFFSAWFLFDVDDEEALHKLMTFIPQQVEWNFRLTRACLYVPSEDFAGSVRDDLPDECLYELTLSIPPCIIGNKLAGRKLLNNCFSIVAEAIGNYLGKR